MTKTNKKVLGAFAAVLMAGSAATTANAGGLEKDYFSTGFLFEKGNYMEVSMGHVKPSVTGTYPHPLAGDIEIDNIGPSYNILNGALKLQLSDALAVGFMAYEPTGYRLSYPAVLPTEAKVESQAFAGVAMLSMNNFHVYGGLTHVTVKGSATELGAPLPSQLRFDSGSDTGYIVGAAYTKPEIALRVAFTYDSGTTHKLATFGPGLAGPNTPYGDTIGGVPESYMLEFQTGIAPNTLLFGSIRKVRHTEADVILSPTLGGVNLSNFSDSITYRLGLGYRINEKLAVSLSSRYEEGSGDPSTLDPTNGRRTLGVGMKYSVTEAFHISAGVSHTWIGDNETGPVPPPAGPAAVFEDNTAWAYGIKLGYNF